MIVSLLLLASCSGGGTNRAFGGGSKNTNNDETFLTGTKGLDIKLADPDKIVVPEGQSAQFDLIVENLGRSTITGGKILLSGFDTKYIKFSSPPTAFDLKGKDRYGPGEQSYLAFV